MDSNANNSKQDSISLGLVFNLFLKNIVLFITVLVMALAVAVVYIKFSKTSYTATYETNYIATTDKKSSTDDYNITVQYFDTVVAFCSQPIVVDRANYYYYQIEHNAKYMNMTSFNEKYNAFIEDVKNGIITYNPSNLQGNKDIIISNLSTSATVKNNNGSQDTFYITFSYVDSDANLALQKLKLIILSANEEANTEGDIESKYAESDINLKYFGTYVITITDMERYSSYSNKSNSRIVLIALVLGAIIGGVIIYLKYALDRTVHTKDVLERITGVNVLAVIEDQEA